MVIDLGTRTTKAIHLHRKGENFTLLGFTLQDAPIFEKSPSPELLSEHLKNVSQALECRTKQVVFAVAVGDSFLRHAEFPQVPLSDMRMMLKFNSKNYLQQDLPDHAFDCYLVPVRQNGKLAEGPKGVQKCRTLVGGAKNQLVNDLQTAARLAGLVADQITPSIVGPTNAFELAQPEVFQKEVVALVDIGFRNSTVNILMAGDLMLSRVVGIGGDKLTSGLAEAMNISYAEAESIKVGMPDEVKTSLQQLVSPLGRELRASLDFFEHQQDKTVSQVFVSGGSARSEAILQMLQEEMMAPCKNWNPTTFLKPSLPPQQMAVYEQVAPQLTVAIGAAAAAF